MGLRYVAVEMMRMLETIDRFLERADRALAENARWPLALFGLALVLKLVYVVHSADALYARVPIMDSKYYDQLAQEIAGGRLRAHDALFMAPLYPLFLSLVYAIAGRDFMLVRLLQVAGGAATVALAFLLGRRLFRPTAALAGALILILYGATTFYESELLVEWMGALLNCAALLILLARRPASARRCAAAGAVLGLSALAGAGVLVFGAFVLGWILFQERDPRRYARAGAFALALVAVNLPAIVHNTIAGGAFAPVTSNAGVNFYIGNGRDATGMFVPVRDVDVIDDVTTREFVERQTGRELGPGEVSAYWFARARDEIKASPARWGALLARKVALYFNGYEVPQIESFDVQRRQLAWLRVLFVPLWFIMAFGLLGMVLSMRAWSRHGMLLGYVLAGAAPIIWCFVAGRFREPVVPVLCMFAGHALVAMPSRLRSFRTGAAFVGGAIALLLATYPGIFQIDPGVVEFREQVRRARRLSELRSFEPALREVNRAIAVFPREPEGYLQRAIVYKESGNNFKAIEDYRRALAIEANRAAVHYDLAQVLRRVNLREDAVREYRLAADYDPTMAQAYNNLGVTYRELQRYDQAIAAFRKAIDVAPGYRRAYNNLGASYAETGRVDEAIATFLETTEKFPDYPSGYKNLAMAYASQKRPRPALTAMKRYAALNPTDLEAGELIRKLEIAVMADTSSAGD
jgi:tetratricopeptide (TPR) repeat protein